jgi:4-hydroxy-tetrahydrodipicolinate reductase
LDAPSGTALAIADSIDELLPEGAKKRRTYGRGPGKERRLPNELSIHAVRAGGIIGEHTVYFAGEFECLRLEHVVYSRDNFALGAIRAAKWIINKPPGLYSMQDVLSIK